MSMERLASCRAGRSIHSRSTATFLEATLFSAICPSLHSSRSRSASRTSTDASASSPSSFNSLVVKDAWTGPRRPTSTTRRTGASRRVSRTCRGMSVCASSSSDLLNTRTTSTATLPTPMTATDDTLGNWASKSGPE